MGRNYFVAGGADTKVLFDWCPFTGIRSQNLGPGEKRIFCSQHRGLLLLRGGSSSRP